MEAAVVGRGDPIITRGSAKGKAADRFWRQLKVAKRFRIRANVRYRTFARSCRPRHKRYAGVWSTWRRASGRSFHRVPRGVRRVLGVVARGGRATNRPQERLFRSAALVLHRVE